MKKKICIKTQMRNIRFVTETHLSQEQFKNLIQAKINRAKLYSDALKKREVETKNFD